MSGVGREAQALAQVVEMFDYLARVYAHILADDL